MQDIANEILHKIEELSSRKKFLIIGIDGRCAAGKTTLASLLQSSCECNVIRMDHFFLRPEQRTAERLQEPGGNVDYERFMAQVLFPLCSEEPFSYRPFDCRTQALTDPIPVTPLPINIIEGSYSCHPLLKDYYHLKIFLTTSPEEQMKRILLRNGEERATMFRDRWIPLEEQYFAACHTRENCDLVFTT